MTTPEQQARDMLERMGIRNTHQREIAGELAELANLIAENAALKAELQALRGSAEPRMLTIEGYTFAAPSSVQTEAHTCGLADALWIRQQDVAAYLAAKDALMDRAIKEQLK